ncbi:hypothetical protein PAPYR_6271 [Paratrimastix pyriformis]|uniref:Uncharacterized protein n=1 Tax=Paratrimastix pyriformis TaxID=342808 RepID=A0ABQ8UIV9_9EUKA|nr:hypothetical protein PAPYR_6271 [Paratrimastix pyriformis]
MFMPCHKECTFTFELLIRQLNDLSSTLDPNQPCNFRHIDTSSFNSTIETRGGGGFESSITAKLLFPFLDLLLFHFGSLKIALLYQ